MVLYGTAVFVSEANQQAPLRISSLTFRTRTGRDITVTWKQSDQFLHPGGIPRLRHLLFTCKETSEKLAALQGARLIGLSVASADPTLKLATLSLHCQDSTHGENFEVKEDEAALTIRKA